MVTIKNSSCITRLAQAALAFMVFVSFWMPQATTSAQDYYSETFYPAEVIEVETDDSVRVRFLGGPYKGEETALGVERIELNDPESLEVGDKVIVVSRFLTDDVGYMAIFEPYRLGRIMIMIGIFILVLLVISGRKGLTALMGLAFTIAVLVYWMIPQISSGTNPLWVSWSAAMVIVFTSLYLAHGFNRRTSLALVSTLIMLHLALGLGWLSVHWGKLFGLGSEEATALTFGNFADLDLRGLLLGAIVIGCLGVLDDVTMAQTATIEQLQKANKRLTFKQLYKHGLAVGKEHITSLVNTLFLAYIGVAFPVLLLISESPSPLWVILNNEFIAEEIVRTLVGSLTLILAVPVSTAIAAKFLPTQKS